VVHKWIKAELAADTKESLVLVAVRYYLSSLVEVLEAIKKMRDSLFWIQMMMLEL